MSVNVFPPVSGGPSAYVIDANNPGSVSVNIPAGAYQYAVKGGSLSQGFSAQGNRFNSNSSGFVTFASSVSSISTFGGDEFLQKFFARSLDVRPFAVAYGNGVYVAGSTNANIRVSTDMKTWTSVFAHTPPSSTSPSSIESIVYGEKSFFACYGSVLSASDDGYSWSQVTNFSTVITELSYVNGLLFAETLSGTFASTTGFTWSTTNVLGSGWNGITFGNGLYVAVGNAGSITYSSNLSSWTSATSNVSSSTAIRSVAYSNGIFVAVGDSGVIRTSTNAVTWATRTNPLTAPANLSSVIFAKDRFIATGQGIAQSTDGITWTSARSFTNGSNFKSMYANGIYIHPNDTAGLLISQDFEKSQLILAPYKTTNYTI